MAAASKRKHDDAEERKPRDGPIPVSCSTPNPGQDQPTQGRGDGAGKRALGEYPHALGHHLLGDELVIET